MSAARPPFSLLHRHAVECVLGFLSLGELSGALRVCHEWQTVIQTMKSIGAPVSIRWKADTRRGCHEEPDFPEQEPRLSSIVHSRLARHIGRLGEPTPDHRTGSAGAADASLLDMTHSFRVSFDELVNRCSELRALGVILPVAAAQPSLRFPSKLETLMLHCFGSWKEELPPQVNESLFRTIGQLVHVHTMTLGLSSVRPLGVELAHLHHLPCLRRLDLEGSTREGIALTDEGVAALRAMHQLQRVHVASAAMTAMLRALLALPHQLQWQDVGRLPQLDEAAAGVLAQLPSLTVLNAWSIDPKVDLSNLARRLPNLRSLQLVLTSDSSALLLHAARAGHLRGVRSLDLSANCRPTVCFDVASFAQHAPLLSCVHLLGNVVSSLSGFAAVDRTSLAATLHELRLTNFHPPLPASELAHLRHLTALRILHITDAVDVRFGDVQRFIHSPSLLAPQLAQFHFTQS